MCEIPKEKRWQYISYDKFHLIEDIEERKEARKKMQHAMKHIINPLYMYALKNGFDDTRFSTLETIHDMVEELKVFYEEKGINREGKIDIIMNKRWKK